MLVHKNCKLAYGTTRRVFLVGNLAIKIPAMREWRLFLLGLLANMQEARFSACGWPKLCPVLFRIPGGFLVVMRRVRVMTQEEFDANDMEAWIEDEDETYVVPAELKADSFGYLPDGRIVAIDYGN